MALLQIAEPGQYQAPHQHHLAIGIDLGTTHSLVASVRSGKVDVLVDEYDRPLLPSVVWFGQTLDGQKILETGYEAKAHAIDDPHNTVISVKRFMGRSIADIHFTHSYHLLGQANEMPAFETAHGRKTPIEISAILLKKLKELSEHTLGGELKGAVITVPAYFDDAQRQATKDAAQLAGLNVFRVLNEPTAAAIAYGLDRVERVGQQEVSAQDDSGSAQTHTQTQSDDVEKVHVIYDFGGGTFDVSILKLSKGVFEVMATGGHTALGGDDVDRVISRFICQQNAITDASMLTASEIQQLAKISREAKEALTTQNTTLLQFRDWQHELSVAEFEPMIEPIIERTLNICKRALRDAKIKTSDIDAVILVGGSTRTPKVITAVKTFFAKTPLCSINPDHVVALGAALLANQLAGNKNNGDVLVDVTPLSIGIETMGGLVEHIISRNTALPIAKEQEFTTYKDGQTAMMIHVLQGERDLVSDCRSLGRFELTGIPPMKAGAARIKVRYSLDADGLLIVSAKEASTGVSSEITIKPSYGLSQEDTARLLQESFTYASLDKAVRSYREEKVEAERELEALNAVLTTQQGAIDQTAKISDFNQALLLKAMQALAFAVNDPVDMTDVSLLQSQTANIRQAAQALKVHSDQLAALLMNQSIADALTGTQLKDWL